MAHIRNGQIVTPENHDAIAEVLADPANAWRDEPRSRKLAHARLRGSPQPADVGDAALDIALERVLDTDDLLRTDWLRNWVGPAGRRGTCPDAYTQLTLKTK
jgi:hypothetical protein